MSAGGDVEKDHFIGTLFIIAKGEINGVAYIAQFTGFGAAELDATGHLAGVNVQARNDTAGKHLSGEDLVALVAALNGYEKHSIFIGRGAGADKLIKVEKFVVRKESG
jgi:hypothetical protein